ncbi:MAG: iron-containing alcohol dehydrogenase [Clostridia bacterium]|nr:iron-containing alcohol dehydrogenase [Clostridia bacterium]
MNMNFYVSTKVITGIDCVRDNADKIAVFGKKCLIVTGETSAKKCGALDDVVSVLESHGVKYEIYDKICQNPTVESCFEAGLIAHGFGADFILGIGGGSPLDASKAIAVVAANPDISEEKLYAMQWANQPHPVVAVGTTAGTGSEVTSVAVITNSKGLKKSFRNDLTYPVLSLGDPKYTMSLSDSFTRSTAVDALAHCVESFFNRSANDISKIFAVAGVKKLISVFDKIISDGTQSLTLEDREQLYNASLLGGYAIAVTGTAFPHALGYFLTENYGVAHGTACAAFLNEFIEYNSQVKPELTAEFFDEIRMEKEDFKSAIASVMPEINVHLTEEDIAELSPRWKNNAGLKRNWGDVDTDFVNSLLKNLF